MANYTQEQIDDVCLSVGWQLYKDDNIAECARVAVEETGMGVYEDKIKKHKVKVGGVCRDILKAKTVGDYRARRNHRYHQICKTGGRHWSANAGYESHGHLWKQWRGYLEGPQCGHICTPSAGKNSLSGCL